VHPLIGGPPKGDCEKTESATVDFTNAKAESLQALFRPEGASTNQPRAERSGDSRVAPPWVRIAGMVRALKGRNRSPRSFCSALSGLGRSRLGDLGRRSRWSLCQAVLWRPFRAEESPGAIFESWTLCVADPRA
jgi:hypothetical protein